MPPFLLATCAALADFFLVFFFHSVLFSVNDSACSFIPKVADLFHFLHLQCKCDASPSVFPGDLPLSRSYSENLESPHRKWIATLFFVVSPRRVLYMSGLFCRIPRGWPGSRRSSRSPHRRCWPCWRPAVSRCSRLLQVRPPMAYFHSS